MHDPRRRFPKFTETVVETPVESLERPLTAVSGWESENNPHPRNRMSETAPNTSRTWRKAKDLVETTVKKTKQSWFEALAALSPEEIRKRFLIETGRYFLFLILFTTSM